MVWGLSERNNFTKIYIPDVYSRVLEWLELPRLPAGVGRARFEPVQGVGDPLITYLTLVARGWL